MALPLEAEVVDIMLVASAHTVAVEVLLQEDLARMVEVVAPLEV